MEASKPTSTVRLRYGLSTVDAPLCLCVSKQEQRPNNEHWCSGVPATREENWEHAKETELTMRTEYVRTRTANLLKYADADRTGVGRCEQNVMETEAATCRMVRHCFLVDYADNCTRNARRERGMKAEGTV